MVQEDSAFGLKRLDADTLVGGQKMKLLKLADRTVSVLGLLLFGTLTGVSLFTTVYFRTTYEEVPYQAGDIFPMVLAVCALLVWLMYGVSAWILKKEEGQEKRIRILLAAVLLYALAFTVWWVFAAKCIPVGDQASVCKAAEGFQNGDYSMLTMDSYERYLYIHPHQLGLTALIEFIFAVFGNGNQIAFQLANCLGVLVCLYSGYRITRLLTEDRRAWIFYLLLAAACFPLFFYVTFVYGEIPSLACSLAAVWCFLEYRKHGGAAWLAGCCLGCALACLIRNNSLILLVAFVLVLLVSAAGERKLRPVAAAVLLVAVFFGARFCLHTVYEQRSGEKINTGAPMILYVAMGMQEGESAPGWSNGYILHNYWGESEFDAEASTAMAVQDIETSLEEFAEDPPYAFRFYLEKFTSQWNDPTYQCFVMTYTNGSARGPVANSMYDGKLHALMTWFMNEYQSLVFAGAFLWLLFGFWKKKGLEAQILLITVIGGFLFHMIWEAKGRYILPYFVMMLPMAAAGLAELSLRVRNLFAARA